MPPRPSEARRGRELQPSRFGAGAEHAPAAGGGGGPAAGRPALGGWAGGVPGPRGRANPRLGSVSLLAEGASERGHVMERRSAGGAAAALPQGAGGRGRGPRRRGGRRRSGRAGPRGWRGGKASVPGGLGFAPPSPAKKRWGAPGHASVPGRPQGPEGGVAAPPPRARVLCSGP